MSVELVSILVLVLVFVLGTVLPVNMGAVALVAAFVLGVFVIGEESDDTIADFPGDLFVVLVGVTYLFAIARNNGTVDWLVNMAVRLVGGRIALLPWIMFGVTAVLAAFGAVVPAAVAIIAPIGLRFARRHGINPMLMGLMIINGGSAGGFSPLAVFGVITNGVVDRSNLDGSPLTLFLGSLLFNAFLCVIVFFLFGGRELIQRGTDTAALVQAGAGGSVADGPGAARPVPATTSGGTGRDYRSGEGDDGDDGPPVTTLDSNRWITLIGLLALGVGALFFELDVGFLAIALALVLTVIAPHTTKDVMSQIAWPTVLLICGIVTYVNVMERIGAIDYLGDGVASIGLALLAALLICYIGAVVSAFASTTGIIGALIPLSVPFLQAGEVGVVGLITALAISSSVVDSSPFSTSGALVVANTQSDQRDRVFRGLMIWGFSMVALAPPTIWLLLVVPGWL